MTYLSGKEIEELKQVELEQSFLPYPGGFNRAQRRANSKHKQQRELTAPPKDTPFKHKKRKKN